MNNLTQFANQNYLNIETYRKSGEPMHTPVWFVQDGDTLYVRTIANSGKVKRVRNNPQVRIMPCGRAGEPLGNWVPAHAFEETDLSVHQRVRQLLWEKYGPLVGQFEAHTRQSGHEYTVIKIVTE